MRFEDKVGCVRWGSGFKPHAQVHVKLGVSSSVNAGNLLLSLGYKQGQGHGWTIVVDILQID